MSILGVAAFDQRRLPAGQLGEPTHHRPLSLEQVCQRAEPIAGRGLQKVGHPCPFAAESF